MLVQGAEDVIELLSSFTGNPRSALREATGAWLGNESYAEEPGDPEDVSRLLTTAPVAVDELIRLSGGSAASVQMALLELELAGLLVRHAGGRVSIA